MDQQPKPFGGGSAYTIKAGERWASLNQKAHN